MSPATNPFRVRRDESSPDQIIFSRPFMATVFVVVFALLLSLFSWRLFGLQVLAGDRLSALANGNRVREVVDYAPRGKILDRHGRVLADNQAGFQLSVSPYQLPKQADQRQKIYNVISGWTEIEPAQIKSRAESQGLNYVLPIAIGPRLSQARALDIKLVIDSYPAVELQVVPTRDYQTVGGLSHLIGYTGLVNQQDLDDRTELTLVDYVGRAGIERQYDEYLRGQNGYKRYEVDAQGKPIRLLASKEPVAGTDISLTVDIDAQRNLARSISSQLKAAEVSHGSGVALQPDTGQVLASVSLPDYDNNLFARGISQADYSGLTDNPDNPLFNSAISGGFPSGSIIKPVVAAAALTEGVVNEQTVIYDRGYIEIINQYNPSIRYRFNGWRLSGLGPMNVRRAIAMSSNIYFFTVGGGHSGIEGLGVDRLSEYYRLFGLGQPTGIDLPNEGRGLVPTPDWKQQISGQPWTKGDTFNISIGQGDLLVSPLQMAVANNVFATSGKKVTPHLLYKHGDKLVDQLRPTQIDIKSEHMLAIREGMYQAVNDGATPRSIFAEMPVEVAGKSGTAEQNTDADQPNHGWFTAFAPYDNPQVMTSILIEDGGGGSATAGVATAQFIKGYFTDN